MVNIAVIGAGYVGLVSGACLADFGNSVICVDNHAEKINRLLKGIIPIYEPGLEDVVARNVRAGRLSFTTDFEGAVKKSGAVFIAVGTPPAEDGGADLRYVEEAARGAGRAMERYTVVVDKSTVPVGTARRVQSWVQEELDKRGEAIPFDVVSNPEFLREGTAIHDFTHPDRVVIGSESGKARELMKEVYRSLYLNETPYIETGPESAEMIKYASNAFLAVKISYINEIAGLCEKTGADVQMVAKAMGRDGRIGPKFLHPGPGYGGSCFPKDTRAIAKTGRDRGSPLFIVEAAMEANERQKKRMVEKICLGLTSAPGPNPESPVRGTAGPLDGKTIAVLGLAFKLNTDDTREAPAIDICAELVRRGAKLRVFDPAAMEEAARRLEPAKDAVYFAADEYDAVEGTDALVIVTEWHQFRGMDLGKVREKMTAPLPCFFDLRNIYKREEAEEAGFSYWGVGR
ncbi:MAG: UDP-glucose/GDP-mannose dehydrogenase family protein [Treponema sp.]|jgi:UDPglucose 6-dehydrogenase|nr:UDP-glucose/GDP-mannose dehydrogenase family protein [Treponema sp.]